MASGAPEGVELVFVPSDWVRFGEIAALRYAVLYEPFGVPPGEEFQDDDPGSAHLVALADGCLVGYGRLIKDGSGGAQIRHIAVDPDHRRCGIGTALVRTLGERAREDGAIEVWLNARLFAMKLYRKLGYERTGEIFKSPRTGILHQRMVLRDRSGDAA